MVIFLQIQSDSAKFSEKPEFKPPTVIKTKPTFIIDFEENGNIIYENVEGAEKKEVDLKELKILLKQHKEENLHYIIGIKETPKIDYKLVKEYIDEITSIGIQNMVIIRNE